MARSVSYNSNYNSSKKFKSRLMCLISNSANAFDLSLHIQRIWVSSNVYAKFRCFHIWAEMTLAPPPKKNQKKKKTNKQKTSAALRTWPRGPLANHKANFPIERTE